MKRAAAKIKRKKGLVLTSYRRERHVPRKVEDKADAYCKTEQDPDQSGCTSAHLHAGWFRQTGENPGRQDNKGATGRGVALREATWLHEG
jgi:hypothetical protein